MERAYDDAKYGRPSQRPYIDCIMPTLVDPTMAPPGKHVMSCFVQYAPYHLEGGEPWDDAKREAFGAERDRHARGALPEHQGADRGPPVRDAEGHRGHHRPERGEHLRRASSRSSSSSSTGRFPDGRATRRRCSDLWMCGSATHPGGGIMGAPGMIAAREYLKRASAEGGPPRWRSGTEGVAHEGGAQDGRRRRSAGATTASSPRPTSRRPDERSPCSRPPTGSGASCARARRPRA